MWTVKSRTCAFERILPTMEHIRGNLANIDVRVGMDISAGEKLGTVGDEGRGPMLYFEIRHGTETVPPGPWLGI